MDDKYSDVEAISCTCKHTVNDDHVANTHGIELKTMDSKATEEHTVSEYYDNVKNFLSTNHKRLVFIRNTLLLASYLVYFGFAVKYHQEDEDSWRLAVCTIFGLILLAWKLLNHKTSFGPHWQKLCYAVVRAYSTGRKSKVIRWFFYIAMTAFMVVYVIVFIARKTPENLRSLMGIFGFPVMLFVYSNNKRKVNWHTVYWGMTLQFIMALIILKTAWGASIISWIGTRLGEYIAHAKAGSVFVFGETYADHNFAFGVMPQAFCLIVGISVLTYLGVIKFVVGTAGKVLAIFLQVSPPEGVNMVGNIFLHVPDSAMLIQEYLNDMTPSQLFITYAGGLTTVGGVSLVIFMASGVPAAPLVAASAMSAPAALAASKLAFPSYKDEVVPKRDEGDGDAPSIIRMPTSLADSVIVGIQQSMAIVVQCIGFLLTFIIILEFLNSTLTWFGDRVGVPGVTIEFIFSYVFFPFAFLMGARAEDCLFIGRLLGIRTFSFAVVAFPKLGPIIQNGIAYREYVSENVNNTWTSADNDIILDAWNKTLVGGVIDVRSEIIATYSLCGSASLALMGFIIGSFGVMLPHRRLEITNHMGRAMVVGTVASYLTACFAGLLFEEGVGYS